jgi:serine/threonine protein kinase
MSSNKHIDVLDRYDRYNIINNIIEKKIKNAKNKCLYPLKFGKYTLNDVIILLKTIGSKSLNANVFISEIKDIKYKFATKVQLLTSNTYKEVKILELITKTSINNKNIHLPLMFNNLECSYFNKNDNLLPLKDEENKYTHINAYYSTFVELADGDLKSFLLKNQEKITLKQINNILSQCFIAILSCHRVNILHNDAHLENFLYHKINKNKKSCFKYEYEDLVFYIENLGFNWVIWDFGYSKFGSMFFTTDFIYDYIILIYTIIEELDDNNLDICNSFIKKLFNYLFKFKNDYDLISFLLKNNILFSDKPIGEIITTIIL